MPTDVVMPQMGESIAEGTIVRWIKKVGDTVDRDEPLFEISTDKVDAEIPSPAAGVVSEIRAQEGETVAVNSVVAVIGAAGEAKRAAPAVAQVSPQVSDTSDTSDTRVAEEPPKPEPQANVTPAAAPAPPPARPEAPPAAVGRREEKAPPPRAATTEEAIRQRSSPLVRKIAKEHNVDISQLHGTGIAGRVTKNDILAFIGPEGREGREGQEGQERRGGQERPEGEEGQGRQEGTPPAERQPLAADRTEKMSPMRKRIAEHMVLSKKTSAHVHSVFEVNFSRVAQARDARKAEFERAGAKLTYLSFIIKAAVDALRAVPIVNASVDADTIVYHQDINIGIAVALDWGLI